MPQRLDRLIPRISVESEHLHRPAKAQADIP
jgi:hypothetical protein